MKNVQILSFFLVRIFPYLDWIRDLRSKSPYLFQIQTRKNSVFGHILRSAMMKLYDASEYLHFQKIFNPFVPNVPFLYPLKTSEKLTVFWCFQGVEKGCIANEWFKVVLSPSKKVDFISFNERHIKLMKMLLLSCKRHGVKVVRRPDTQNPQCPWYSRYLLCPWCHRDPMNVETNRNQYFST